ncbi:MAG: bifunctional [glutamine synthetase] adenylyltransferase/[glutamine synthetase]-adenylyl-L-tyrosine phosphorylase, partial [Kiloniellales bacterium]
MQLFFHSDIDTTAAPRGLPGIGDRRRAALGLERWREAVARAEAPEIAGLGTALIEHPAGRALLECVFGNSPFLTQCLLSDLAFAVGLLEQGPDVVFPALLGDLRHELSPDSGRRHVMRELRIARRRAALTVALADLTGTWSLEQTTGALSDFADTALGLTVAHLLCQAAADGVIDLASADEPERDSGLIVLAMGKLGARELNYSSDIDLIVLYDDEKVFYTGRDSVQSCFVRLAQDLVSILGDRTADGYVFRTDLRLRPDPGATPLAISVAGAETYYGSVGQNWERAAMIKARPVAGDKRAGAQFLRRIRPFVWRKHLDFAAIQDIHSIKRQIDAYRGGKAIELLGHNIKLGRGGIREIEFLVQTLQLIWGGRDPALRVAQTCEALARLAAAGRITGQAAGELAAAYRFLRTLEHRLQMVDDHQTHSLPRDAAGMAALGAFMGYDGAAAFGPAVLDELQRVVTHYAGLFEGHRPLGGPGALVFTGSENDPDTLETLSGMGFSDPPSICTTIRGWHHGRYRATRSVRARELLTELMPALLLALARTANPDVALAKFNEFLANLPAGVQLFSLFQSNPGLLDLVAEIMGSAPRLALHLSRHPGLLDFVLTADFFEPVPARAALAESLDGALAEAELFQDVLEATGRWTNDLKFQVGLQVLRHLIDAEAAGRALTDVAETALAALYPRVEAEFAAKHGRFREAGMAVVALGKLGGHEFTHSSDLDLVFIYDPAGEVRSDGDKPLDPVVYFSRLGQRLIGAITARTGEGRIYEVDMRLRPSGAGAPIASQINGFARYQRDTAWTWEHMALTRARPIAGPPTVCARVGAAIRGILTAPRDPDRLVADVADMRVRMAREHQAASIWEVKHLRGGLVDAEFIAQYLQLRHASEQPEVLATNTITAYERLAEHRLVDQDIAAELIAATRLWHAVQGFLRLTVAGRFDADDAPESLRRALARAASAADFAALEASVTATARRVHGHFQRLIEAPAAAVRDDGDGEAP